MDRVLSAAAAEVGYLEKKSNSQLDNPTANAGSNNYTKYARDYKVFAGKDYQGQAWCDMFVDWCFVQAYGVETARAMLGDFSAYTPDSAAYFKKMGRWYASSQAGDVIFFKNDERIYHTGIVYKVDAAKVYTIEGNTSGASEVVANGGGVCKKSYTLGYSRIAGYGRPDYTLAADSENVGYVTGLYQELLDREPDAVGLAHWTGGLDSGTMSREQVKAGIVGSEEYKSKHTDQTTLQIRAWVDGYLGRCVGDLKVALCAALQTYHNRTYGAGLLVDGSFGSKTKAACRAVKKGSKGDLVYICQAMLYIRGYDPKGFDGSCGPGCDSAIRQYQKDHGLTVDGSCGPNTFYSMFH